MRCQVPWRAPTAPSLSADYSSDTVTLSLVGVLLKPLYLEHGFRINELLMVYADCLMHCEVTEYALTSSVRHAKESHSAIATV